MNKKITKILTVTILILSSNNINAKEDQSNLIFNADGIIKLFEKNHLKNIEKRKIWWERMVRGEVGKHRFYILCSMKDGEWKRLDDVRNYIDFKSTIPGVYTTASLMTVFELMRAQRVPKTPYYKPKLKTEGEGWIQKSRDTEPYGVNTKWRIHPDVLPFLYLLLLSCPEDNSCEIK
jgi:hypothetical protein